MKPRRDFGGSAIRSAFSLVELLVVIAVLGILASLLMVSIQSTRESARRLSCLNNFRQIGIALHVYHSTFGTFPAGGIEPRHLKRGGRQLAWSALVLPQLEQGPLAETLDYGQAFDHPSNAAAAATVLPVYLCPSTPRRSPLRNGRGACDYGGIFGERIMSPNDPPKGAMVYDRSFRIRDIRDGLGTTLVISEDSGSLDGQWINGRNLFDQAFPINAAPPFENDIRSRHPGGANGLFCDGSARFLGETIARETLAAICTRDGREVVEGF